MYTQVLCKQEDEIFVLFLLLKKYTEENVLMLDIRNLNQPSKPHHSMDLMRPIYQASLIAQLVKNPPANAGNPGSIPGSERAPAEGIGYPLQYSLGFPCGSAGKETACNAGDLGSISGLGRSPGERKGYPLQSSGLENSMDCIVHGVAKSQTQLSDFHFTYLPTNVKYFEVFLVVY